MICSDCGVITVLPILSLFFFPFLLLLVDKIFHTHISCTLFGWHNGNGNTAMEFDGCSIHSTCSKCGEEVMQDGQGNWF